MTPQLMRALQRLSGPDALLQRARTGGGFGVYPGRDRRRRPVARISADDVRVLASDGVLIAAGDGYALTEAGRKLLLRTAAQEGEGFSAQHRPIGERPVIDRDGAVRKVRGHDANARLRRLETLKDVGGAPLLDGAELGAAAQLLADWDIAQAGLLRGSDWAAAPLGESARGADNAQERAMAKRCDARARLGRALDGLAPPLRRAVESICRDDIGLEGLERAERWPARSGKLALKFGLAQVAATLRSGAQRRARGELDAVHHGEEAI